MSATTWNLRLGSHSVDLAAPVLAALLGGCVLFAMREPEGIGVPPSAVTTATPGTSHARGSLVGVVEDLDGAPMPGARVRLVGESGETILEVSAARESRGGLTLGEFRVDDLPEGRYAVVADLDGARSGTVRIPISAWEDTRVRLHLGASHPGA